MARSRFAGRAQFADRTYGIWDNVAVDTYDSDGFAGIRMFEHVVTDGERLDQISARYLNDDGYHWVIALVNAIINPLDLTAGQRLRIPYNVDDVLERVQ
jgi:hypothetical protein